MIRPARLFLREELAGLATIVQRDLVRYVRDRSQVVSALARPIVWLFFLGYGLRPSFRAAEGGDYLAFVFPGILALTLVFTSILSGITIIWDREFGFLRAVLVAPVSRTSIALGKMASGAVLGTVQAAIVLLFAPLAGVPLTLASAGVTLGALLLSGLALAGFGVALAARMSSFEGFGTIVNLLIMPLYFLSAALFPPVGLPPWLMAAVRLNPLSYAVDALRHALFGAGYFPLALDVAVLAAVAAALDAAAVRAMNRME